MSKKVSVIIPVYKTEKYLEETVNAFLKQTYRDLEIILVDDGSPDNCGAICDLYERADSRVKVIHQQNKGLGAARNAGLAISTGDYITFCDSDDIVSEDYIEYLLSLNAGDGTDITICQVFNFIDGNQPNFELGINYPSKSHSSNEALKEFFYMRKIHTGIGGKLFSRSLTQQLCFPEGIYYEDIKPMYNMLLNSNKILLGYAKKYGYRQRNSSITHEIFSLKELPCITEWEDIYRDVSLRFPNLKTAAASRMISTNAHVFFRIPPKEYEGISSICWGNIKKYRKLVLFDYHARKKAWAFSFLSLFGKRITYYLGKCLIS